MTIMLPELENIQAIIIGGPGATKDFVVKNEYFHHEIAKKIAATTFDVAIQMILESVSLLRMLDH